MVDHYEALLQIPLQSLDPNLESSNDELLISFKIVDILKRVMSHVQVDFQVEFMFNLKIIHGHIV